ncbi:hypothetical protein [Sulfurimonas sp.]|uniref:hypothetical protein n=1 Tax=Sulfurimonas sp. TaxID=2022749 RepID=UPI00286D799C|nr:hypothetical protein [Sulfurimonas sp.]
MLSNIYKSSLIAAFTLALSGCAGHVYTVVNPTLTEKDTKVEGIITYPQTGVYELYKLTRYFNKDKNTTTEKCEPEYSTEYAVRTDYDHPQIVRYSPGLFENNSFALTLQSGVIASVDTTSDTTEAFKEVASILNSAIPRILKSTPERVPKIASNPPCNAGKRLVNVYRAPAGLPFDQMQEEINKER